MLTMILLAAVLLSNTANEWVQAEETACRDPDILHVRLQDRSSSSLGSTEYRIRSVKVRTREEQEQRFRLTC
jgi:hypothetical protein